MRRFIFKGSRWSGIVIYRINTVVLKDAYSKVFRYELIVCAGFILTGGNPDASGRTEADGK